MPNENNESNNVNTEIVKTETTKDLNSNAETKIGNADLTTLTLDNTKTKNETYDESKDKDVIIKKLDLKVLELEKEKREFEQRKNESEQQLKEIVESSSPLSESERSAIFKKFEWEII